MPDDLSRRMLCSIKPKRPKPKVRAPAKAVSVTVPLSAERLDAIDTWRAPRKLTRAQAVDELVCRALRAQDFMNRMKR